VEKSRLAESGEYNLSGEKYNIIHQLQSKWSVVPLDEILRYEQPTDYIVTSTDYKDTYSTPVLTAGQTFILGHTNEEYGIFSEDLPVIIFDDFTTATKLVNFPFKVKSSAMKILHAHHDMANIKFVYHMMQHIKFDSSTHKRYWISEFSKLSIPLPPLSVQEEIVAELDSYQKIIDGARQVVDNYKPHIDIDPNWDRLYLGDLVDIFNGSTPSRGESKYWKDGQIPWFTIDDIRKQGRIINCTEQSITAEALKETSVKLLPCDTVLLCCTASLGEYAYANIKLTTNQQFNGLVIKDTCKNKIISKYLFWYSSLLKPELVRVSGKATFGYVSISTLKKIQISIPPLETQISITDRIENEQKLVEANRQLIALYEQKIKDRIAKIWKQE